MKRVLVIDDAPDIRTIARLGLGLEGFEVFDAEGGAQGLDRAREVEPDLILLDVMMPEMDGPATLSALRAQGYEGPIVFLTAKVQRHEIDGYLALGADAVVPKPFDPMGLGARLREIHAARG